MTTSQEKQVLKKINTILGNVLTEANQLKTMMDIAGNEKFSTKIGEVSLLDLVNPSKLDIQGFIGLIGLMGRKQQVFGDCPADVIQSVCVEIYGEALNKELKIIFG